MTPQHLHLITFNIPWPPDYGGVTAVMATIKTLHRLDVRIHLHCFEYSRPHATELEHWCYSVNYYPRQTGWKGLSFTIPYIVQSRMHPQLIHNLQQDNYPILAEGLHCTGFLQQHTWPGRSIAIRLHNIESVYYKELCRTEKTWFKKWYYRYESRLLHQYEQKISALPYPLLSMHPKDAATWKEKYDRSIDYLPVLTMQEEILAQTGIGHYILCQGDLSVAENEASLLWLLNEVLPNAPLPVIIAGKQPSQTLINAIHQQPNVQLMANPTHALMTQLTLDAQVHLVHSTNRTGIKIKLLNTLLNGRHCIVQQSLVTDTQLERCCHIAVTAQDFRQQLALLARQPFTQADLDKRKQVMKTAFNNTENATRLMQYLQK